MNKSISASELRSWENSLPQMAKVLRDANVKDDTHILLEYKLPSTEKRIDFAFNSTMTAFFCPFLS
ncbi:hypothetical protein V6B14_07230 [Sporosarcina psychrophila]|uniref:hypothetical protein n=1 Tax=Sporosarcina psychrophila TaxID=1476 RepID=UPI0030CE252C